MLPLPSLTPMHALTYMYMHMYTEQRDSLGFSSFGVSQTTMEEVFMKTGIDTANDLCVGVTYSMP